MEVRNIFKIKKPLSVQWETHWGRVEMDWFRNGKELENFIKTNPENKLLRIHQTKTFGMGAKIEKTLFNEAEKPITFADFYKKEYKGGQQPPPNGGKK